MAKAFDRIKAGLEDAIEYARGDTEGCRVHTTEELKKLPSETDWERAAAMTNEEIEAAVASDPDEAGLDDEWMKNAIVTRPNRKEQ